MACTTMLTVLCLPLAYPNWTTASFFSSSMIKEGPSVDFLTLYLPSNPFFSLANTIVPAVVVFSILFGTALITLPNKENVIDILHTLSEALMKIASFVAKLAPFGIFAIAASAAGTLYPGELEKLQIHLWVYLVAWSILAFLTLPLLVSLATPFSYRDVLRGARVAMVTAFAVGTVLVVLPMIAERCKALLAERKMESDEGEVSGGRARAHSLQFSQRRNFAGIGIHFICGMVCGHTAGFFPVSRFHRDGCDDCLW